MVALNRQLPTQPHRDAWVEINLQALEDNARALRAFTPPQMACMAVIKADAYGHSALACIPVLQACGFDSVAVASIDEALQLRQAQVDCPILVLGASPAWAYRVAAQQRISLTVFTEHQLAALHQYASEPQFPGVAVQVKVDTGMHRIGVPWSQAAAFVTRCQQLSDKVRVEGIFTHLACADQPQQNTVQLARWQQVLAALPQWPQWRHVFNSEGATHTLSNAPIQTQEASSSAHTTNLTRWGLALYGYGPPGNGRPVMGLKARVVHCHSVGPGEGVSYHHTYRPQTQRVLATIPVGYADGVPRGLSNRLQAVVHGQRVPQVGLITMDQMMLDVTSLPDIQVGDTVTLLGDTVGLTLSDWAKALNTIEYELMCALRVRLPRVFVRG